MRAHQLLNKKSKQIELAASPFTTPASQHRSTGLFPRETRSRTMGDDLGDEWGVEELGASEGGTSMVAAEAGRWYLGKSGICRGKQTCGAIVHRAADSAQQQVVLLLYPTAVRGKTTGMPYLIDDRHTAHACFWSSLPCSSGFGLSRRLVLLYISHDTTRCGVSHLASLIMCVCGCVDRRRSA